MIINNILIVTEDRGGKCFFSEEMKRFLFSIEYIVNLRFRIKKT